MNSQLAYHFCIALSFLLLQGCKISFDGASIDPNASSFYVDPFEIKAPNAPPTLSITAKEALQLKIQRNSRLLFSDQDPSLEFISSVSRFRVSSVAPQPNELSAFNRLEITFQVEYINNLEGGEEEGWKKSYTLFSDFDASLSLLDVQDDLIETILQELTERVFNDAFSNW